MFNAWESYSTTIKTVYSHSILFAIRFSKQAERSWKEMYWKQTYKNSIYSALEATTELSILKTKSASMALQLRVDPQIS